MERPAGRLACRTSGRIGRAQSRDECRGKCRNDLGRRHHPERASGAEWGGLSHSDHLRRCRRDEFVDWRGDRDDQQWCELVDRIGALGHPGPQGGVVFLGLELCRRRRQHELKWGDPSPGEHRWRLCHRDRAVSARPVGGSFVRFGWIDLLRNRYRHLGRLPRRRRLEQQRWGVVVVQHDGRRIRRSLDLDQRHRLHERGDMSCRRCELRRADLRMDLERMVELQLWPLYQRLLRLSGRVGLRRFELLSRGGSLCELHRTGHWRLLGRRDAEPRLSSSGIRSSVRFLFDVRLRRHDERLSRLGWSSCHLHDLERWLDLALGFGAVHR